MYEGKVSAGTNLGLGSLEGGLVLLGDQVFLWHIAPARPPVVIEPTQLHNHHGHV